MKLFSLNLTLDVNFKTLSSLTVSFVVATVNEKPTKRHFYAFFYIYYYFLLLSLHLSTNSLSLSLSFFLSPPLSHYLSLFLSPLLSLQNKKIFFTWEQIQLRFGWSRGKNKICSSFVVTLTRREKFKVHNEMVTLLYCQFLKEITTYIKLNKTDSNLILS